MERMKAQSTLKGSRTAGFLTVLQADQTAEVPVTSQFLTPLQPYRGRAYVTNGVPVITFMEARRDLSIHEVFGTCAFTNRPQFWVIDLGGNNVLPTNNHLCYYREIGTKRLFNELWYDSKLVETNCIITVWPSALGCLYRQWESR